MYNMIILYSDNLNILNHWPWLKDISIVSISIILPLTMSLAFEQM